MVPYSKFKSGLWLPRQRPSCPVEINWNHALAPGLVGYWLLGGGGPPIDLVTGLRATLTTGPVTPKVGPAGLEDDFGQTANSGWNVGSGHLLTSLANFSTVVGFRLPAVQQSMWYTERAASGNDLYKFGTAGTPQTIFTQFRNDGGTLIQSSGTITLTGAFTVAGLSYNTTNFRHFIDGKFDFQAAWGSNNTFTNASTVRAIGYDPGDSSQSGQMITFVALWNRTLTDAEQTLIGLNPYDILKPKTSVEFFDGTLPVTGTIAATTKKPASSLTGTETFSATIAATTKKPATAITSAEIFSSTLTATTKKPTTAVTAVESFTATVTPTTKKPATSITALAGNIGTITPTTRKPATSITAVETFSSTLTATTKKPATSVAGTEKFIGTILGSTKKPGTSIAGVETYSATIAASTKKAASSFSAAENYAATVDASTKKPSSSVAAVQSSPGTIAAATKKPAVSIAGFFIFSGTISTGTKKPITSFSTMAIDNFIATFTATTKKATTNISGVVPAASRTATIDATTAKPSTSFDMDQFTPRNNRPFLLIMS